MYKRRRIIDLVVLVVGSWKDSLILRKLYHLWASAVFTFKQKPIVKMLKINL